MNQSVNTLIISKSFIITKALLEIIPDYFHKIEYIDKCEDFDILLNKIEKQNFTIIFIDEIYLKKFQFFLDKTKGKAIVIPIVLDDSIENSNLQFTIKINDSKQTINRTFAKLVEHTKTIIQEPLLEKELTNRESIILQMIAKGFTSKQIGDKLGISTQTVSSHRKNISSKLEIKTVSGLTVYAILNNLISVDEANLS